MWRRRLRRRLCYAGDAGGPCFPWWGRIYLGRLWSSAITRKEDHRIVDTGPMVGAPPDLHRTYRCVPGDGGGGCDLTAVVGAALVIFGIWLKASSEERFLMSSSARTLTGPTAAASRCSFRLRRAAKHAPELNAWPAPG